MTPQYTHPHVNYAQLARDIIGIHFATLPGIYDALPFDAGKERMRRFLASEEIRKVEDAVTRQYNIILEGAGTEARTEDAKLALQRVKEGMAYFAALVRGHVSDASKRGDMGREAA